MAKKTRIFNDAEDKNVAATIVYTVSGSEGLYWDEEGENPVYADEALRLVATGAMVFGGVADNVFMYGKLSACILSDEETMVYAVTSSSSPVEVVLPNRPAEEDEEDEGGEDEIELEPTPTPSPSEVSEGDHN